MTLHIEEGVEGVGRVEEEDCEQHRTPLPLGLGEYLVGRLLRGARPVPHPEDETTLNHAFHVVREVTH